MTHNIEITNEDLKKAWKEVTKEYDDITLEDPDMLIKGMLHVARRPIAGVAPNETTVMDTMWSVFLQQLMMGAIELGSKGIARK